MAIPIPHRASGFTLGNQPAVVNIDIFFDIQCPHSKRAWPTILELLTHYDSQPVCVTAHLLTLSNHRQSWDISLGLFAVAQGDAQRFFDFVTFLFARQDEFFNEPFRHKTHQDLRNLVAEYAYQFARVDKQLLLTKLDDHDIYVQARTPIRYAATRSVWATPTLFINNADDVPVSYDSSLQDWMNVIKPLLE